MCMLYLLRVCRYVPRKYYEANAELKKAIDQIHDGFFSPKEPSLFHDLTNHLLNHDTYVCTVHYHNYITHNTL